MTWVRAPLAEVADFCLGKMLDQKKNKGIPRPYLANVNVRWGSFLLDGLREMRFGDHEIERFGLKSGDIVMCEGGEPGRCAIWKNEIPGMMFQKAIHRIRPHSCLDHRFLYYTFLHYGQTGQFAPFFTGATISHLPREKLAMLEIAIPPLSVQQTIVSVLTAYDDLIQNNTRRIAILEEIAQAIYREWFVSLRFPGHEQVEMVESELGPVPARWEVVPVTDAVEFNPKTQVPAAGEKSFVPMDSLSTTSMLIEGTETRSGNSGSKFRNGDTLFARITPCLENGKTGFVQFLPTAEDVAFGSTEFIVLRSRTLCPEIVYLMARSAPFRDHAIKSMSGATGRQRVQEATFKEYRIAKPDQATVHRFSELVAPQFRMMQGLAERNRILRRTRDLLLPRLITGEVSMSADENALIETAA